MGAARNKGAGTIRVQDEGGVEFVDGFEFTELCVATLNIAVRGRMMTSVACDTVIVSASIH